MSTQYGKLVRDKVPEIIEANGETPVIRILEDREEIDQMLGDKLYEEVGEFLESGTAAEAGDVLAVFRKILERRGVTFEEAEAAEQHKRAERGGFDNFVYLVEVEDV